MPGYISGRIFLHALRRKRPNSKIILVTQVLNLPQGSKLSRTQKKSEDQETRAVIHPSLFPKRLETEPRDQQSGEKSLSRLVPVFHSLLSCFVRLIDLGDELELLRESSECFTVTAMLRK